MAWAGTDDQARVAAHVAFAPAGGAGFSAPQRLGRGAAGGPIDLAVNPSGDIALVWTEDGGREVHAAVRRPRASFVEQQIHGSVDRYVQHVAIAPSRPGRFVTAFQTRGTKADVINPSDVRIARYEPGGGSD